MLTSPVLCAYSRLQLLSIGKARVHLPEKLWASNYVMQTGSCYWLVENKHVGILLLKRKSFFFFS